MGSLAGRNALVTGASRGIGRAIALKLASEGANILVNYANSASAAEDVVAEIRKLGVRAEAYQADVSDRTACESMVDSAIKLFGQVDILVNNAGIGSSGIDRPTITEATYDQYELLLGANLWGPIYMSKALVPHMRSAERSDIVMISSVATDSYSERMGLYSIGKAGMEALAYTLAKEERSSGMRVNVVAPGLVDTDMGRKLITLLPGSDDMRERDTAAPFGFVCTPEDIASAVYFLVSENGRYLTNQRIAVNGGGF
ncbi:MAG TPA: SDR family oxidoreductase [Dehalococcoidia bacterium]|jgi:NAD(P)-dependent dehydrogenase (short-subunit alcohol dehydrogenase family)|nr:SDR family oxidoreductase [Dehalococcoidia bacterium]